VIGASSGATMTYSNVTQEQLAFIMAGVRPWLSLIETTLKDDPDFYPPDVFGEFLIEDGLRADPMTEAVILEKAGGGPYLTPNEVRRMKRLPPIEGGDKLRAPLTPVGEPKQGNPNDPKTDPPPEPAVTVTIDELRAKTRRRAPHADRPGGLLEVELRADRSEGTLRFKGHAAVFDRKTQIGRSFTESVKRGAFRKALDEHQDVVLNWDHDSRYVMARTSADNLDLREDPKRPARPSPTSRSTSATRGT
jgi:hypothetical protein